MFDSPLACAILLRYCIIAFFWLPSTEQISLPLRPLNSWLISCNVFINIYSCFESRLPRAAVCVIRLWVNNTRNVRTCQAFYQIIFKKYHCNYFHWLSWQYQGSSLCLILIVARIPSISCYRQPKPMIILLFLTALELNEYIATYQCGHKAIEQLNQHGQTHKIYHVDNLVGGTDYKSVNTLSYQKVMAAAANCENCWSTNKLIRSACKQPPFAAACKITRVNPPYATCRPRGR